MEHLWTSRLRWRMRGAWMWPAFFGFTVAGALALHVLPITGDGTGIVPGLLLCGFINLIVVGVAAPLAGHLLRRRRPDLPLVVAGDYAGTALLALAFACIVGLGVAHRPDRLADEADLRAQFLAVRRFVLAGAPPAVQANLGRADAIRIDTDLYRTCIPGRDPRRSYCLIVNTDQSPPGIRRDTNRQTNQDFLAPGLGAR
ncbi:MAG: hypothetical protein U0R70_09050 [Solirubrobacteraceae bacterium]